VVQPVGRVEEGLYDSVAQSLVVGIDLGREPAPEETTVCRHLLEEHNRVSGGGPRAGTTATLLRAPSPVKEEHCAGTPERVYSVRLLGAKIPI
jgi:hypothetical protein